MSRFYKKTVRAIAAALVIVSMTGCSLPFSAKKEAVKVQTEGDLSMDSVIMRVGNIGVTYREALIYMYQMKEKYEPGFGEEVWKFAIDGDKSFGEYAKEEVMDNLTQIKVIVQEAEKQGISLDEDELSDLEKQAEDYLDGITSRDIKRYGLTKEFIESVYQDNRLAEKMYDVTTSVVDTDISDEEAKQISIQYLAVLTSGTDRNAKKIKLKKKKELAEAEKRAKKLRKQALQAADFGNFADANSELSEYEITYGAFDAEEKNTMDLPQEILDKGLQMKTGQLSKVISAEDGFYILYCVSDFDEDATKAKKEEMIEEEQEDVFAEAYTEWSADYEVEIGQKLWDEISFETLGE
jgi:foldase protein PrsA